MAHKCENSFDSWTPSGVLYFKRPNCPDLNLELLPSWIQDDQSNSQKTYVILIKNVLCVPNPTWNFVKLRSGNPCTGDEPFGCKLCKKRFKVKSSCIRHIRRHDDRCKIKCRLCDFTTTRSEYLIKHAKEAHNGNGYNPTWKTLKRTHDQIEWNFELTNFSFAIFRLWIKKAKIIKSFHLLFIGVVKMDLSLSLKIFSLVFSSASDLRFKTHSCSIWNRWIIIGIGKANARIPLIEHATAKT